MGFNSAFKGLRVYNMVKVKVKFILEQAMKAQTGNRVIAQLFLKPRR